MNWVAFFVTVRNKKRGIQKKHSFMPYLGQFFIGLSLLKLPLWLGVFAIFDISLLRMILIAIKNYFYKTTEPTECGNDLGK